MLHPYQNIVASGSHIFVSVKNHIQVFSIETGDVVGAWEDEVDASSTLKKQQAEKIKKLSEDNNESQAKIPKIPTPGPGAPPIYNYIIELHITSDFKYLIGATNSDKAIVIFSIDFDADNCLTLVKRQPFMKRPSSIAVADNNTNVVVGDKFGDVYQVPIDSNPPIPEKDLSPILGHVSMLTKVLVAQHNDKQYVLTSDRDEHIRVSNYPESYIIRHWLFGHDEFISSMITPACNPDVLITGGGDDKIFSWDWYNDKLIDSISVREYIQPYLTDDHLPPKRFLTETSPKEITVVRIISIDDTIVVLFENIKALLVLKVNQGKFSFKQVVELPDSLVDIAFSGEKLAGISYNEDNKLLQFFDIKEGQLVAADSMSDVADKISNSNACTVNSSREFYPLFNMNGLRKRSEH